MSFACFTDRLLPGISGLLFFHGQQNALASDPRWCIGWISTTWHPPENSRSVCFSLLSGSLRNGSAGQWTWIKPCIFFPAVLRDWLFRLPGPCTHGDGAVCVAADQRAPAAPEQRVVQQQELLPDGTHAPLFWPFGLPFCRSGGGSRQAPAACCCCWHTRKLARCRCPLSEIAHCLPVPRPQQGAQQGGAWQR